VEAKEEEELDKEEDACDSDEKEEVRKGISFSTSIESLSCSSFFWVLLIKILMIRSHFRSIFANASFFIPYAGANFMCESFFFIA
jgi:hypothetical protein